MSTNDSAAKPHHRWLLLCASLGLVLLADQLTKWWAVNTLKPPSPVDAGRIIDVVGSLRFRYAENTGMAFSRGAESGRWIGLLVMAIVVVLFVVAARATTRAQVILLGVVIGGALGNLLDRAFRAEDGWLSGAVVDFIDLQWWPVFNIADAAVVVGGILLVLFAAREPGADEQSDAEPPDVGPPDTGPESGVKPELDVQVQPDARPDTQV